MHKHWLIHSDMPSYKANLHCHSTYSDGTYTPAQLKEMYVKQGYSIVAFTDHEHLISHSDLRDDTFLPITACEIAVKEFPKESTLVKTDMRVTHLNFYAKDADNTDTPCYNSVYDHFHKPFFVNQIVHSCGEYTRVYSSEGISEIVDLANKNGFLVSYNHPDWSLETPCDFLSYQGLWAAEIYNHSCMTSGVPAYNIQAYDAFLRKGCSMVPTACDDNHNLWDDSFGGFCMIQAESLSYKDVISAMESHRLYASTGPLIHGLYVENNTAYLMAENGLYAAVSTDSRRAERKQIQNGVAAFAITPNDKYIRFTLTNDKGQFAHTCAYYPSEFLK